MECNKIEPLLYLYAGGDISGDDLQKTEEHIRQCTSCRDLLSSIREARTFIRGMAGSHESLTDREKVISRVFEAIDAGGVVTMEKYADSSPFRLSNKGNTAGSRHTDKRLHFGYIFKGHRLEKVLRWISGVAAILMTGLFLFQEIRFVSGKADLQCTGESNFYPKENISNHSRYFLKELKVAESIFEKGKISGEELRGKTYLFPAKRMLIKYSSYLEQQKK